MKKFTLFLIFSLIYTISFAQDNYFSKADAFFKKYVTNGKVKYGSIKSDRSDLDQLVHLTETYSLSGKSKQTQKAFYLNAYNVMVIKGIVEKYPIAGPMAINGFFDKKTHKIAGKTLTLNDLENKVIRPTYKDARIHFALVCAANGCPKIASFAFTPERVESQLTSQTKKAMNDNSFIKVKGNKVQYSEIFNWYKVDFIHEAKSIIDYINKYRTQKIPSNANGSTYSYDWALNKA